MATQLNPGAGPSLPDVQTIPAGARKKLVRRPDRDRSQRLRFAFQAAFLMLNLYIGVQFYFFVRHFETGGRTLEMSRPAGVEGWLPIAGLMNLKYLLVTGTVPSIHPAAMFLLIAFLAISVAFRKAFCGWLCPVGTLSEALWKLGRRYLKGSWRFPRWIDLPLRSLKYLLLALFVYAIAGMSAAAIEGFLSSPYGLVADVKMLNFFRFMGQTAAITIAAIAALSVLFQNFWCRYLCPYGALMGLFALVSPSRVQRDPERCIDCARCARACPSLLPVDQLVSVRSAECMACLECVAACPAKGALRLSVTPRRGLPVWALAAGIGAVFVGIVLFAKATGSWDTAIPSQLYQDLILRAHEFGHP